MLRTWIFTRWVAFDTPAEVLEERAVEVARVAGITPQPYRVGRFERSYALPSWIAQHDRSLGRWERLRSGASPVRFWLRQSPDALIPRADIPAATMNDPPLDDGHSMIVLDHAGRLMTLVAQPASRKSGAAVDWQRIASLAQLDLRKLRRVAPSGVPPVYADARLAWEGAWPGSPEATMHVEAASENASPVWFAVTGPWDAPQAPRLIPFSSPALDAFVVILNAVLAVVAVLLAWHNFRVRRGDRAGAVRLAVAVFAMTALNFVLTGDHRFEFSQELALGSHLLRDGLLWALVFAFLYLALEPYVRRRWPERLIGWSRLLAGKWRDPMVGRDVLIGVAGGAGHAFLATTASGLPPMLGLAPLATPRIPLVAPYLGVRFAVGAIFSAALGALIAGLILIVLLVALTIIFRRKAIAVGALYVVILIGLTIAASRVWSVMPVQVVLAAMLTVVIVRGGLLATVIMQVVFGCLFAMPIATDTSWTFATGIVPLVFVALLALYAFRISLGGQQAISSRLFDA
jgi:serine/threonine-protein kinase